MRSQTSFIVPANIFVLFMQIEKFYKKQCKYFSFVFTFLSPSLFDFFGIYRRYDIYKNFKRIKKTNKLVKSCKKFEFFSSFLTSVYCDNTTLYGRTLLTLLLYVYRLQNKKRYGDFFVSAKIDKTLAWYVEKKFDN